MGIGKRFKTDQRGATAMLFGLALVPVIGLIGAAVDYGRASSEQAKLQRATDAAVLALVKEPRTASKADLEAKAAKLLGAMFRSEPGLAIGAPRVERVGNAVTLSVGAVLTNAFMQVVGFTDAKLDSEARAAWGTERIEVALVLDNTGSMNDLIKGQRKIDALIGATKSLLADFKALADREDAIKVSVVTFDTEVRLDPSENRYKDWFRPGMKPSDWTGYVIDRHGSFATSDAPIGDDRDSRYPTVRETGYKVDPDLLKRIGKPIDLPAIRPLTSLFSDTGYRQTERLIESMRPRGYTNISLGVTWGLATLSRSEPFTEGAPSSDTSVKRYMIVLTDGNNTAYHKDGAFRNAEWERQDGNWRAADRIEGEMNAVTSAACTAAKKNVDVFTVRLLEGDEKLLAGCASPPNDKVKKHYFDVQSPPALSAAFREILDGIGGTKLTH